MHSSSQSISNTSAAVYNRDTCFPLTFMVGLPVLDSSLLHGSSVVVGPTSTISS